MTNTQIQSRLMTIPGELRNRIYRYALLKDKKLKVTAAGYERSPLFLVCKAVREEVLEIYYYETTFQVVMPRYDTTVLLKFLDVVRTVGLEIGTNCEDDFKFKVEFHILHICKQRLTYATEQSHLLLQTARATTLGKLPSLDVSIA